MNINKYFIILISAILVLISPIDVFSEQNEGVVYVIPIRGEITPAMAAFVSENIDLANTARAEAIIIEISTLGGRADAAMAIKDSILNSAVPVIVYIQDRAVSAGALISIAANYIAMAPGSHMGAAEPVPNDPKAVSAISAEFKGVAEVRGRDPQIAAAMVDRNISIPNLTEAGSILSITAEEAYKLNFAEVVLYGRANLLEHFELDNFHITEIHPDVGIRIAQFLTRTEVSSILLTIGMLAIAIEVFTAGFGIAGIIGISSFALYFGGGFLAGHTEWWPILLFAIGAVLLIAEAAVPGFGVLGISGIVTVLASLVLAAPDPVRGATAVGIAFITSLIAIPVLGKIFGWTRILGKFVMAEVLTVEGANVFIEPGVNLPFPGDIGVVVTQLRPAGIVEINGRKFDVVSDGDFIQSGENVKVVQATASKIVVVKYSK